MMNEFCIDIEVGELRPLSSAACPPAKVPNIEGRLVGDLPSIEALGDPAPMVPLLAGEALPPLRLGLAPKVLALLGELFSTYLGAPLSSSLVKFCISKGSPFLFITAIF